MQNEIVREWQNGTREERTRSRGIVDNSGKERGSYVENEEGTSQKIER